MGYSIVVTVRKGKLTAQIEGPVPDATYAITGHMREESQGVGVTVWSEPRSPVGKVLATRNKEV